MDIDKSKRDFYHCDTNDEEQFEAYTKNLSGRFTYCNSKLRRSNVKTEVIDSEMKHVWMLSQIRELDKVSPEAIADLTGLWETLKETLPKLQTLAHRFQHQILRRLSHSCVSYLNVSRTLKLTQTYSKDVIKYQSSITHFLRMFDGLVQSFENKIAQDLFTNTHFSDRILVNCDRKAFPILRLVPDLTEKLVHVCSLARQWIDKDETYVHNINSHIREARLKSRKAEANLRDGKQKQNSMSQSVSGALKLFRTSKEKLAAIEAELKVLDEQLAQYTALRANKLEERRQKQGIVGFLDIGMTQTRKNLGLQLKRARLLRQLRELEVLLEGLEKEMNSIQADVEAKRTEKQEAEDTVAEKSKGYKTLKSELDAFTHNLNWLEKEVCEMTDGLTQLEIIQTFKTSPEKVEDFYDRPMSVKLTPALQEKIRLRKRKLMNMHDMDKT